MTKPDLMAELAGRFGFVISDDECRILTYTSGGCRPANANECLMWDAIRTHHAELEAVVRDAARYRFLREGSHGECELEVVEGYTDGCESFDGDKLDAAVDRDMAMHNSAREG